MDSFNIVIATKATKQNEWACYAAWYSVHKTMPEVKTAVVIPRSDTTHTLLWLSRCGVPYLVYPTGRSPEEATAVLGEHETLIGRPTVIIHDHMMVIRPLEINPKDGMWLKADPAISEDPVSLVDYSICGKFNWDDWGRKERKHPFHRVSLLNRKDRTINESRVLDMWRTMALTFDFVNRP